METLSTLTAVALVSLVHLYAGRMRFVKMLPRSTWLSFAGGVALAYVFVYLLPQLAAKHQVLMQARDTGLLGFLEHHAYLVALAGFLVFYGLNRVAQRLSVLRSTDGGSSVYLHLAFDLQVAGFSAYNVLVGYLIVRRQAPGMMAVGLFAFAVAMHFLGVDRSLWRQNEVAYARLIRWLFAGCAMLGWTLGQFVQVTEPVLALWFAFLAGSIMIIVITEEVPTSRRGPFWPLFVGAVCYTALVLGTEALHKAGS
jgi:hypothetical protein